MHALASGQPSQPEVNPSKQSDAAGQGQIGHNTANCRTHGLDERLASRPKLHRRHTKRASVSIATGASTSVTTIDTRPCSAVVTSSGTPSTYTEVQEAATKLATTVDRLHTSPGPSVAWKRYISSRSGRGSALPVSWYDSSSDDDEQRGMVGDKSQWAAAPEMWGGQAGFAVSAQADQRDGESRGDGERKQGLKQQMGTVRDDSREVDETGQGTEGHGVSALDTVPWVVPPRLPSVHSICDVLFGDGGTSTSTGSAETIHENRVREVSQWQGDFNSWTTGMERDLVCWRQQRLQLVRQLQSQLLHEDSALQAQFAQRYQELGAQLQEVERQLNHQRRLRSKPRGGAGQGGSETRAQDMLVGTASVPGAAMGKFVQGLGGRPGATVAGAAESTGGSGDNGDTTRGAVPTAWLAESHNHRMRSTAEDQRIRDRVRYKGGVKEVLRQYGVSPAEIRQMRHDGSLGAGGLEGAVFRNAVPANQAADFVRQARRRQAAGGSPGVQVQEQSLEMLQYKAVLLRSLQAKTLQRLVMHVWSMRQRQRRARAQLVDQAELGAARVIHGIFFLQLHRGRVERRLQMAAAIQLYRELQVRRMQCMVQAWRTHCSLLSQRMTRGIAAVHFDYLTSQGRALRAWRVSFLRRKLVHQVYQAARTWHATHQTASVFQQWRVTARKRRITVHRLRATTARSSSKRHPRALPLDTRFAGRVCSRNCHAVVRGALHSLRQHQREGRALQQPMITASGYSVALAKSINAASFVAWQRQVNLSRSTALQLGRAAPLPSEPQFLSIQIVSRLIPRQAHGYGALYESDSGSESDASTANPIAGGTESSKISSTGRCAASQAVLMQYSIQGTRRRPRRTGGTTTDRSNDAGQYKAADVSMESADETGDQELVQSLAAHWRIRRSQRLFARWARWARLQKCAKRLQFHRQQHSVRCCFDAMRQWREFCLECAQFATDHYPIRLAIRMLQRWRATVRTRIQQRREAVHAWLLPQYGRRVWEALHINMLRRQQRKQEYAAALAIWRLQHSADTFRAWAAWRVRARSQRQLVHDFRTRQEYTMKRRVWCLWRLNAHRRKRFRQAIHAALQRRTTYQKRLRAAWRNPFEVLQELFGAWRSMSREVAVRRRDTANAALARHYFQTRQKARMYSAWRVLVLQRRAVGGLFCIVRQMLLRTAMTSWGATTQQSRCCEAAARRMLRFRRRQTYLQAWSKVHRAEKRCSRASLQRHLSAWRCTTQQRLHAIPAGLYQTTLRRRVWVTWRRACRLTRAQTRLVTAMQRCTLQRSLANWRAVVVRRQVRSAALSRVLQSFEARTQRQGLQGWCVYTRLCALRVSCLRRHWLRRMRIAVAQQQYQKLLHVKAELFRAQRVPGTRAFTQATHQQEAERLQAARLTAAQAATRGFAVGPPAGCGLRVGSVAARPRSRVNARRVHRRVVMPHTSSSALGQLTQDLHTPPTLAATRSRFPTEAWYTDASGSGVAGTSGVRVAVQGRVPSHLLRVGPHEMSQIQRSLQASRTSAPVLRRDRSVRAQRELHIRLSALHQAFHAWRALTPALYAPQYVRAAAKRAHARQCDRQAVISRSLDTTPRQVQRQRPQFTRGGSSYSPTPLSNGLNTSQLLQRFRQQAVHDVIDDEGGI